MILSRKRLKGRVPRDTLSSDYLSAHSEWLKELRAGRRYKFLDRYNDDICKCVPEKKLKSPRRIPIRFDDKIGVV